MFLFFGIFACVGNESFQMMVFRPSLNFIHSFICRILNVNHFYFGNIHRRKCTTIGNSEIQRNYLNQNKSKRCERNARHCSKRLWHLDSIQENAIVKSCSIFLQTNDLLPYADADKMLTLIFPHTYTHTKQLDSILLLHIFIACVSGLKQFKIYDEINFSKRYMKSFFLLLGLCRFN